MASVNRDEDMICFVIAESEGYFHDFYGNGVVERSPAADRDFGTGNNAHFADPPAEFTGDVD